MKVVLSLVVTATGNLTLYANGDQKWFHSSGEDYTKLIRAWDGAANTIAIGRNTWDGWSTFNGHSGDVFVYKVAARNLLLTDGP